jgi:single-strand DNA-binding protein
MNSINITGRLTKEPQLFNQEGEKSITARFSLAYPMAKDSTGFIDVICFGSSATIAGKFLHKGNMVALTGRLNHRVMTSKDSNATKINVTEIVANEITLLPKSTNDIADSEDNSGTLTKQATITSDKVASKTPIYKPNYVPPKQKDPFEIDHVVNDDDLPF